MTESHFEETEYIDGVPIDHKTFYEKLIETDVLPTTIGSVIGTYAGPGAVAMAFFRVCGSKTTGRVPKMETLPTGE